MIPVSYTGTTLRIILVCCWLSLTVRISSSLLAETPPSAVTRHARIAVIGGGASGTFAAISAANQLQQSSNMQQEAVTLYEASDTLLRNLKKASQNGYILHDTTKKPRELLMDGYPRGRKEISSVMTKQFSPVMQRQWFESKGVTFATERDGRVMVEEMEDGNVAIDAILETTAADTGLAICTGSKVTCVQCNRIGNSTGFILTILPSSSQIFDSYHVSCDCIILATGSSFQGYQLANSLGHSIVAPVRSMFAFRQSTSADKKQQLIDNLSPGSKVSAPHARISLKFKLPGQKRPRVLKEVGPIDFGCDLTNTRSNIYYYMAGKAALKLASFAARELKSVNYKSTLYIHFCPDIGDVEKIEKLLWQHRLDHPKGLLFKQCPLLYREVDYNNYNFELESFAELVDDCVPREIWQSMCMIACGATGTTKWGNLSPKKIRALADCVVGCPFDFDGRHFPLEEELLFVNSGGISLKEVNMSQSMESCKCDGLFLCGQVLDIDGSSVGYNFMCDWATGYTAGVNAAKYLARG